MLEVILYNFIYIYNIYIFYIIYINIYLIYFFLFNHMVLGTGLAALHLSLLLYLSEELYLSYLHALIFGTPLKGPLCDLDLACRTWGLGSVSEFQGGSHREQSFLPYWYLTGNQSNELSEVQHLQQYPQWNWFPWLCQDLSSLFDISLLEHIYLHTFSPSTTPSASLLYWRSIILHTDSNSAS